MKHEYFCSVSDMFISTLFKPGIKINPDHRPKYVHILAYASCVSEVYKKVTFKIIIPKRPLKTKYLIFNGVYSIIDIYILSIV